MNGFELANALEAKDKVRYADFIVALRTNAATVHHLSDDGLVIAQQHWADAVLFPKGDAVRLASRIPKGKRSLTIHGTKLKGAVEAGTGYKLSMLTSQYVYTKDTIENSFPEGFRFRPVSLSDKAAVTEHYHLLNEGLILQYIRDGRLTALEAGGELVGFIGIHYGGSMGALEVFPGKRRNGYGEALERYLIADRLSMGLIPFCHIIDGNVRSLLLQKKLGLVCDSIPVYWL